MIRKIYFVQQVGDHDVFVIAWKLLSTNICIIVNAIGGRS